jgi:hypothetical protein
MNGVNELKGREYPLLSRGGVAATSRKRSQYLIGAAGVVLVKQIDFIELDQHHPVCAMNGAARHFIDRTATPPLLRRGYRIPAIDSHLL